MKLFTRTDLERAARLAAAAAFRTTPGSAEHVESIVTNVVQAVAQESEEYYSEHQVEEFMADAATNGFSAALQRLKGR